MIMGLEKMLLVVVHLKALPLFGYSAFWRHEMGEKSNSMFFNVKVCTFQCCLFFNEEIENMI